MRRSGSIAAIVATVSSQRRCKAASFEIVNATEAGQDGRIHIEKINGPFLFKESGNRRSIRPARHRARLAVAA